MKFFHFCDISQWCTFSSEGESCPTGVLCESSTHPFPRLCTDTTMARWHRGQAVNLSATATM